MQNHQPLSPELQTAASVRYPSIPEKVYDPRFPIEGAGGGDAPPEPQIIEPPSEPEDP